jgi:hypothetical protein
MLRTINILKINKCRYKMRLSEAMLIRSTSTSVQAALAVEAHVRERQLLEKFCI